MLASGSHELVVYGILLGEMVTVNFDSLISFVVECHWVLEKVLKEDE